LFIVLYPLGVGGEIGVLAKAVLGGMLDQATKSATSPWIMRTFVAPALQFLPFWLFVIVVYGPGLSFLYGHMLSQRKRILGNDASKVKSD